MWDVCAADFLVSKQETNAKLDFANNKVTDHQKQRMHDNKQPQTKESTTTVDSSRLRLLQTT